MLPQDYPFTLPEREVYREMARALPRYGVDSLTAFYREYDSLRELALHWCAVRGVRRGRVNALLSVLCRFAVPKPQRGGLYEASDSVQVAKQG